MSGLPGSEASQAILCLPYLLRVLLRRRPAGWMPLRILIPVNMSQLYLFGIVLSWIVIGAGCWLVWQLLRQNGRVLLRLDELEERLDEFELGEPEQQPNGEALADERASRFAKHSLARSKLRRDGLKAGAVAPDFRLTRLDGGELSLAELRDQHLLLVFSDPNCGPCNHLAPTLQKFQSERDDISLVMISRGEVEDNRRKAQEHGLTFPILLQHQWEISRRYAIFATPVAYLIDDKGIILRDVAVGIEPIEALMGSMKSEAPAIS